MNTMLADSLDWIAVKLEEALKGGDRTAAVISVLKELMSLHGNAVFGGDGYSSEWHEMAVKERGLKNLPTTADALPYLQDAEIVELFKSTGVLTPVELESRYEIYAEQYILSIEVEAKLVVDMAKTLIYPAAISYLTSLSDAALGMKEMGIDLDNSSATIVAARANAMMAAVNELAEASAKEDFASTEDHMKYCADVIRGLMGIPRE